MPVIAFVLALAAAIVFLIEAIRTRGSLVCIGLTLLTIALIVQFVHPVADVTVH